MATEIGILHQLKAVNRKTKFIPVNDQASCKYMKMITPAKLLACLRYDSPGVNPYEIHVPDDVSAAARLAVERMIEIGESGRGGE